MKTLLQMEMYYVVESKICCCYFLAKDSQQ